MQILGANNSGKVPNQRTLRLYERRAGSAEGGGEVRPMLPCRPELSIERADLAAVADCSSSASFPGPRVSCSHSQDTQAGENA